MKLLEPIKVGNIEFKNRIMFPPLTTGYEEKDGSIGEQSFRFYERLAKVTSADIRDTEAFIKLSVRLMWESIDSGCGFAFATNGGNANGTATGFVKTAEQCEGVLRMLAQLSDSCSFDFGSFLNALNYGSFTDVIILTPYIDDEMALFAKELESRDKAAVFYTTGNIPENTDAQILHARKFSLCI